LAELVEGTFLLRRHLVKSRIIGSNPILFAKIKVLSLRTVSEEVE
jgi:hypothetical protein